MRSTYDFCDHYDKENGACVKMAARWFLEESTQYKRERVIVRCSEHTYLAPILCCREMTRAEVEVWEVQES